MGEIIQEEMGNICTCVACGEKIRVASYLGRGELAYCEECEEPYIIESRYPTKLQSQTERKLEMPWLDGFYFI